MNKKNETVNRGTNDNQSEETKLVVKSFEELEFKDDFMFGVIMMGLNIASLFWRQYLV